MIEKRPVVTCKNVLDVLIEMLRRLGRNDPLRDDLNELVLVEALQMLCIKRI